MKACVYRGSNGCGAQTMKPINTIIIVMLAVFIGITLYVYHSSHLKAALWTFAFYYCVWELMVFQFKRIDRGQDPSELDEGRGD